MKKHCLITNDVETLSNWYNCIRDETGEMVLKEGMPLLLELYQKFGVKCTFYFTGYIATKFPDVVKMILPYGHEVGCHGFSHKVYEAFDTLTFEQQCEHLKRAKDILESISGKEIVSFRAPALRVNHETPKALEKNGFKIDSSIASQRFDMFLSYGNLKKLRWLTAPRLPYRTRENDLYKPGKGSIIEIPVSALGIPYIGTTLRIFPTLIRMVRSILHFESSFNQKPIVFLTHPTEFLNEKIENLQAARRAKNFFGYIFSDLIRHKIKLKNLGRAAIPLLEHELRFFKKKHYQFISVRDYCETLSI